MLKTNFMHQIAPLEVSSFSIPYLYLPAGYEVVIIPLFLTKRDSGPGISYHTKWLQPLFLLKGTLVPLINSTLAEPGQCASPFV